MRLTLRTLLAYLDDVLEPSETKLMGQKIQESAVAGKLISLIRMVVRQRRLKAPSVSGPQMGIDPNIVAQYLDNTLPPEQVVEVERVLLTSDELLAEVASCHQVLALVMGKPVDISEVSRDRLYALGPVARSEQLRIEEAPAVETPVEAAAARDAEKLNGVPRPVVSPAPAVHEIPEYLRQSSWSQRIVPTAIICLLVLVCGGLLYLDPSLLPGLQEAKRELAKVDRDSGKSGPPSSIDSGSTARPKDGATNKDSEVSPKVAANTAPRTRSSSVAVESPDAPGMPNDIDLPPPADAEPPLVAKVKPAGPTVVPNGVDAPGDATLVGRPEIRPAPADGAASPQSPVADEIRPPVALQYLSNDGVVIRWDVQAQHWYQLPRRSVVAPGEMLAIPEPFEAVLDIDHGAVTATVLADSLVRVMGPNRSAGLGLNVHRGRILLNSSHKNLPTNCSLTIGVGNDVWTLEILPDTFCTIEVLPREPVQFEKTFDEKWYVGVLRVLTGSVKWTSVDGQSQVVAAQKALEIVPFKLTPGARPAPVSYEYKPEWTDSQKRKQSPQSRKAVSQFEKEFELDHPIEQAMLALIRHRDAKVSEFAVRCLGLIEAPAALVQALAECDFEEGRFAARDGIRAWLGRQADHGPVLKAVLETHFPPPEAAAAYFMLWGFRPEDGANRLTSIELVSWLHNSHVAIRELAFYWITQLTNRKWEYRATDVQNRRDAAARKIENVITKDGALVKPIAKENPPTPKPD